jgi:DNA-binding CsgD family transcriptional regulator
VDKSLTETFKQIDDWFSKHPEHIPEWLKQNPDRAYALAMLIVHGAEFFPYLDSSIADIDAFHELGSPEQLKKDIEEPPNAKEIKQDFEYRCLKYGHDFCKSTLGEKAEQCPIPEHRLTAAEQEVFNLICGGYEDKDIAEELGKSVYTIKNQIKAIFDKLMVHSRTEAVFSVVRRYKLLAKR